MTRNGWRGNATNKLPSWGVAWINWSGSRLKSAACDWRAVTANAPKTAIRRTARLTAAVGTQKRRWSARSGARFGS